MNALLLRLISCALLGLAFALPRAALAADCVTDMDCPGAECGGQVCQWLSTTNHVCQDAGSKSRGSDGWCNTASDCKCQSAGAKCNAQFSCSFVLASDAPAGGGMSGSGGMPGVGGSSGGAAASSGADTGGTTSAAGSAGTSGGSSATGVTDAGSPNAGTTNTAVEGPILGSPSASDGGCALSRAHTNTAVWPLFGALAALSWLARRRR